METAKDISKKIRSAIKAKLVELGAYVDDELPDYIMVMVANKKTQNQMTEDLSLFLGAHTDKFTTWLHGLLVKLQNLSSEKKDGEADKPQDSVSKTQEKKSPVDSKSKEKSSQSKPVKTSPGDTVKKTAVKRKLSAEDRAKVEVKNKLKEVKAAENKGKTDQKIPVNQKERDEDYVTELLEKVETDEFSEEFNKEQEQEKTTSKAVKPLGTSSGTKRVATQSVAPQVSAPKMIPTRDLSYPQTPKKKKVVSKKVKTVVKKKVDSSGAQKSSAAGTAGKRFGSVVVGTVKQKYREVPDDEEYDPLNPSFGKLASSVKVSRQRRLTVPPSLQANKALIMKATAEAEKSVSSALHNVLKEEKLYSAREKATVKPIQRKLPELRQPKIRPNIQLTSKSRREELLKKMTYTVENDEEPEDTEKPENMKIVVQNRLKTGKILQNTASEDMTYTVINRAPKPSEPGRVQYISQPEVKYVLSQNPGYQIVSSTQPALQYLAPLSSGAGDPQILTYVKLEPHSFNLGPEQSILSTDSKRVQHVARVQPVMDSRLVKRKSFDENEEQEDETVEENEEEEVSDLEEVEEDEAEQETVDTDDTSNEGVIYAESPQMVEQSPGSEDLAQTESPETYDSEEIAEEDTTSVPSPEPVRYIKEKAPVKSKPKPAVHNPKFIVTLDGIDPSAFGHSFEEETPTKQDIPVVSKITPPVITPISFNLKDTDDEEEEQGESPSKKSKITEKCKFWPACSNGNNCTYHHPSVPCKSFPNCKFGDKCLYIHPNCKFDAKCTKRDCPFTHASKRGTSAPTVIKQYIPMPVPAYNPRPQGMINCRFGASCQNQYCPFQHPVNCRYGNNCGSKSSCPFAHPGSKTNEKYSWTANKSNMNTRSGTGFQSTHRVTYVPRRLTTFEDNKICCTINNYKLHCTGKYKDFNNNEFLY